MIHTMPKTLLKLKYILSIMGCTNIELNGMFEDVLQNDLFKDLRISDQIPFHLITDLTIEEQKEKLYKEIIPLFKKILNLILRLKA